MSRLLSVLLPPLEGEDELSDAPDCRLHGASPAQAADSSGLSEDADVRAAAQRQLDATFLTPPDVLRRGGNA